MPERDQLEIYIYIYIYILREREREREGTWSLTLEVNFPILDTSLLINLNNDHQKNIQDLSTEQTHEIITNKLNPESKQFDYPRTVSTRQYINKLSLITTT